jgi:hypothetical protein
MNLIAFYDKYPFVYTKKDLICRVECAESIGDQTKVQIPAERASKVYIFVETFCCGLI